MIEGGVTDASLDPGRDQPHRSEHHQAWHITSDPRYEQDQP
jgi:hypothetical protein